MVKKLVGQKLIKYNKKTGAIFTNQGNKIALDIVRKHRLWEVFLSKKLNYSWDVVHDIAEQLEHIKHNELADRLDKYLGYPDFDPHGDPIPNADGEFPITTSTILSEIQEGKACRVTAVNDASPEFLKYLEQLKIQIGTKIKVIEKIPFDGSFVLEIGKIRTSVSKKVAISLFVT